MGESEEVVAPGPLLTMQIIIGALTMGVVSFLALSFFIPRATPATPPDAAPPQIFLSYVAVAFAATALPMSVLVPRLMVASMRKNLTREPKSIEPGALIPIYQTQLIAGAALNEGAAFFAVIAFLLEKTPLALGLAVVLILGIVARFPTRSRVEQWIDAQIEKIDQDRQFAG